MRIVIGATGPGGTVYLLRLLEQIDLAAHQVHLIMDAQAKRVAPLEIQPFRVPPGVTQHAEDDDEASIFSGTVAPPGSATSHDNRPGRGDAMAIMPCTMSTLGQLAHGSGNSMLLRVADRFLTERRPLVLVPQETPWNVVHARNIVSLLESGAIVFPAIPCFSSNTKTVNDLADTLVDRIMDQLGLALPRADRRRDGVPGPMRS